MPDRVENERNGNLPIWSIGGGKGGTGKTFVAASMGLLFSENQVEVSMIDADLGAANLHTFLGVQNPPLTLGDFISKKVAKLSKVMLDTRHPGLKLAAGCNQHYDLANLSYLQKQKLLRHIKSLNHRRTIIDTGGGTYFNCLDFFPISDIAILVVNPDPASIENTYQFLRSVTLRILQFSIRRHEMDHLIEKAAESQKQVPRSIKGLLELVSSHDNYRGELLKEALGKFRPCLIINKAHEHDDAILGKSIVDVIRRCLAIDVHYVGAVPYDEDIRRSLIDFKPYVLAFPCSKSTYALRLIADRLLDYESTARPKSP